MSAPLHSSPFDYLIVGAGTAGCVLASRLSTDPRIKVLLLEAGADNPPGSEHPAIQDPFPLSLSYSHFCWPNLTAEVGADLGTGAQRFSRSYLQGYGVGGGSNVQGMVALRGHPQDYEEWREGGALGWGWEDVLPYFRRLETDMDFDGPLHGREGPIPIRRIMPEKWAPFSKAFAECVQQRGFPLIRDLNADFRAGVGPMPMANLPNRRVSVSMAYLDAAARRRSNLCLHADTRVERIEIRGLRAIGAVAATPAGRELFKANQIIISAGALHSPAILMRSGIGPSEHLRQHEIEVAVDRGGVGQHLMNHVGLSIAAHLPRHAMQPPGERGFGQSCLQFASGVGGAEYDILVGAVNKSSWHPLGRRVGALGVEVHKTHSRGEVQLCSKDPAAAPSVKFNLLSDSRDLERLLIGFKLCLEIFSDASMETVRNELFLPNGRIVQSLSRRNGWNWMRASAVAILLARKSLRRRLLRRSTVDPKALLKDTQGLRNLVLQRASPAHHVSSTCRMGLAGDSTAVVDADCRVLGIENLRVIDASVMPSLVRANTHIPVIMIAEKMAERIRSSPP